MTGGLAGHRERGGDPQAQAGAPFLAAAGRILADSLDYETTLGSVAALSLPYLGAWCIVDVCREGEMRRAAVVHADPEMQELARQLTSGWPPERDDPFGLPRAVLTRETEIIRSVPDEMLAEVAHGEENLRVLRALGMGSLLVVPLVARGDVLGAITYVSPRGGRVHGREDVALAEDLAARCAIALDNSRAYAQAEAARRKAEEASAAKGQFLAVMSHELRTPLTGVVAYAELIETEVLGALSAKQREACERIRANSWYLVSIIDEILTLSRAEAGRLEVRAVEVDVVEVAREAARILETEAQRRGVAVHFESAQESFRVRTDPGKVRQILLNLVGNATKFTESGEIRVVVEVPGTGEEVRIHVSDTGRGVALEDQELIFEPFTQVNSTYGRATGGTGLGLSISRKLARLMGGDVTIRSAPGDGSTFTFHLPAVDKPAE